MIPLVSVIISVYLRGSKYVQSKIGDTYNQAKDFLDSGRKVLFTGTPCQIGGLYSYLRKHYENLFTQDIICHGVPSPMVWTKYVDEREKRLRLRRSECFSDIRNMAGKHSLYCLNLQTIQRI